MMLSRKRRQALFFIFFLSICAFLCSVSSIYAADFVWIQIVENEEKELLPEVKVSYEKGDTPLSILKRTLDKNDFAYTDGYVTRIFKLHAYEKGLRSGWVYWVNKKMVKEKAGSYCLNPGDRVIWDYVYS